MPPSDHMRPGQAEIEESDFCELNYGGLRAYFLLFKVSDLT